MTRSFGLAAGIVLAAAAIAHAGLIITPTFNSSITTAPDASAIEGAIQTAIGVLEADITNSITVDILFGEMSGGLGESETGIYQETYYTYYNALLAAAASADQLIALASLGPPPTPTSGNPVDGNEYVDITSADGRALGLDTPAAITVGGGTYDAEILFNASATSPPESLSGSTYGLEAVVMHEMDETLGIGGTGSSLGNDDLTGPVGALDLYRYTCSDPGSATTLKCPSGDASRSYSDLQTTSPYAYFSINGGATILSYFNQTQGDDYGDWLSNPIPAGFPTQVQDAFGTPGTNPSLGVNELTALNVVGYDLATPEPSTLTLTGLGLILGLAFIRRTAAQSSR